MIEDLSRLLDRDELSEIFRNFSDLTGLNVSLRDLSGQDIVSFFREESDCICKMIGNCEMCLENIRFGANKAAELGEPYIFICGCGLVMCASAVVLEDTLIGAVFCGPAMLWDADDYALAELRKQHQPHLTYGFGPTAHRAEHPSILLWADYKRVAHPLSPGQLHVQKSQ